MTKAVLGIIGAGGIGEALYEAQQLFFYHELLAYLLITCVIVGLFDIASTQLRKRYRVSWEAAIGRTTREVFHDNTKAWSGDHCVDPTVVPGVLFCNRAVENDNPRLLDIAPTVLDLFGVKVPDYMDGKALTVGQAAGSPLERAG